jgi:hypothetical protein
MEFALVLSGLIHDVGHPGLSAAFLSRSEHELSYRYSDDSPLERYHLSLAYRTLQKEGNFFFHDRTVFGNMKGPITRAVLGTDMALHGQQVIRMHRLRDDLQHNRPDDVDSWYWPRKAPMTCKTREDVKAWELDEQVTFIMELFLHAADIASPTMPFDQFRRWNQIVQQEFHLQGDKEKKEFGQLMPSSPKEGYDRDASEATVLKFTHGFVQFVVLPMFNGLNQLTMVKAGRNVAQGVDLKVCLENIERNEKTLLEHIESARQAESAAKTAE